MRVAFPTDEHVPFQDDRARSVALQIVSDFDPELLVVGSDAMDFYAISDFDKDPNRSKEEVGLQGEIELFQRCQREWRDSAPSAKRKYIPGNHEDRLRRLLWRNPGISDLESMRLPNLLGFESLGIEYNDTDYRSAEINLFGKLVIRHGKLVRSSSAMTARAESESEKYSISTMTGHTHRGGTYYTRTRHGVVIAQECFCLCRLDPEYKYRPDWQQGIVLAEVTKDSLKIEPILFQTVKGKRVANWNGKQYTS